MNFFLEHPMLVTYLFLKLDSLTGFLSFLLFVSLLASLGYFFYHATENSQFAPHGKKIISGIALSGLLIAIVPSAKDVAIMYGVSAGVTVGKNIATSPITEKSLELLNIYVEKELDKAKNSLEKSK